MSRKYLVRVPTIENMQKFSCVGTLEKFEKDGNLRVMRSLVEDVEFLPYDVCQRTDDVTVVGISISISVSTLEAAQSERDALDPFVRTWAEKSRRKNRRGWRLNAIAGGYLEKTKSGSYVARYQVLLGDKVFYNQNREATISYDDEDLVTELEHLRAGLNLSNSSHWITASISHDGRRVATVEWDRGEVERHFKSDKLAA